MYPSFHDAVNTRILLTRERTKYPVTCDKIEEHLFPVICEFFSFWFKTVLDIFTSLFFIQKQVWSTSEMIQVFRYSGAVAVFISKCCQITSNLLRCILFSVELSFMSIKYVSTVSFSCHMKIQSGTLLNIFYFFCTF